jgi:myo-inositol-1(or 4)-monophosphatase
LPAASPVEAPSLALALEEVLREAGAIALRHFRKGPRRWTKADGTPVSEADLAVDDFLRPALRHLDPGAGWLSEETADEGGRRAAPRTWIVDPIDGTSAFLEGTESWCIVAALALEGRPVAAGIYRPPTGGYYSAVRGEGAFLNGQRLSASSRRELAGARVITSPKVLSSARWPRPWPPVVPGMTSSLALRLCLVAEGVFDAALAVSAKSDWDLAAGDLIVHEAGGRMSDLEGAHLHYNRAEPRQSGFVASGEGLHAEIVERTREW